MNILLAGGIGYIESHTIIGLLKEDNNWNFKYFNKYEKS